MDAAVVTIRATGSDFTFTILYGVGGAPVAVESLAYAA